MQHDAVVIYGFT